MATHDIILIGASAGGVQAISALVADLPREIPAAVFVVLHLARGRSVLPEILTRAGRLPAAHPVDGEHIRYGRVYVAPPDHHMTIERDTVRVLHGPTENGLRPALDPLFRSAARTYGPRVVGVVLTGSLDDGTAGLAAVKGAGGVAVVQDPAEAFAPSMPRSALEHAPADHSLPLRKIGQLLVSLTRETTTHAAPSQEGGLVAPMESEDALQPLAVNRADRPGAVSVFTCPECNGTLWEVDESGIQRFRCRVGHVYTADSMLAAQTDSVDRALWAALRALEERAALLRRMCERARRRNHHRVDLAFEERAMAAEAHAATVRDVLLNRSATHVVPDHTEAEGPPPAGVLDDDGS